MQVSDITRLIAVGFVYASALLAQPKILVGGGDSALATELQSATSQAKVMAVSADNVMKEIADADAFIGDITSAEVRAGKNSEVGGSHERRRGARAVSQDGTQRSARQQHHPDEQQDCARAGNRRPCACHAADAVAQSLCSLQNDQQQIWEPRSFHGIELRGKTAVVIGVGGIGTQIAFAGQCVRNECHRRRSRRQAVSCRSSTRSLSPISSMR